MKHFNLATKQLANAHGWCVCSNSTQKKKKRERDREGKRLSQANHTAKNFLESSYVEIIIAQLGAIFITLGKRPVYNAP